MTREEAIEVVRKNLPHLGIGATEMTDALGTLIPELRESEDERIRRWLVELVENQEPKMFIEVKKMDVFAWLEKQKEPQYTKRNALFDKCVENCDPEVMKEVSDKVDEMLGKEQKPVEWSEEDEAMRDNILRLLSCFVSTSECDSNPSLSTSYPAYQREIAWLKSLRPQYHGDVTMTEAYKMGLEAGKASSWKPSEEQMEALKRASTNEYLPAKQFDILVSLYEQLKKL